MRADQLMGAQQFIAAELLVKGLHQQLRAVAVDGQAASTFLAAMEQAVAVRALVVQFSQQGVAVGEGGAQRLIQSGPARGLDIGGGSLPVQ